MPSTTDVKIFQIATDSLGNLDNGQLGLCSATGLWGGKDLNGNVKTFANNGSVLPIDGSVAMVGTLSGTTATFSGNVNIATGNKYTINGQAHKHDSTEITSVDALTITGTLPWDHVEHSVVDNHIGDVTKHLPAPGTTSQYLRGDDTWQILDKNAVGITGNVSATNSVIVITGGTSAVAGGVGIGIVQSTTSQNGFLTSSDWNSFNNKQSPITAGTSGQFWRGTKVFDVLSASDIPNLSATYVINSRIGTSGGVASLNTSGYIPVAQHGSGSATSATYLRGDSSWATLDKNAIGITGNVSATNPVITITGGVASVAGGVGIGIAQATSAQNGFLTSSDWNLFNNKVSGVSGLSPTYVLYGSSTSGIGQTSAFSFSSATGLNITSGQYLISGAQHTHDWTNIATGKPTTYAGYGINDVSFPATTTTPADLNTPGYLYSRYYITASASTNRPADNSFIVDNYGGSSSYKFQTGVNYNDANPRMWFRNVYGGSSWNNWSELWHSNNFNPANKQDTITIGTTTLANLSPNEVLFGDSAGKINQSNVFSFYNADNYYFPGPAAFVSVGGAELFGGIDQTSSAAPKVVSWYGDSDGPIIKSTYPPGASIQRIVSIAGFADVTYGGINLPAGKTYNVGGSPHTHSASTISGLSANALVYGAADGSATQDADLIVGAVPFQGGNKFGKSIKFGHTYGYPAVFGLDDTPNGHMYAGFAIPSGGSGAPYLVDCTTSAATFKHTLDGSVDVLAGNINLSVGKTFNINGSPHTHIWAQVSATPTTLGGYGITDAIATSSRANISATTPVITIVGGTNAVLGSGVQVSISQATSAVNGYLTSGDFGTFNGKLDTTTANGLYVKKVGDTVTGVLNISNATASTTTTTGALVVTGGVGIGGAVNVGGSGDFTGNLTCRSSLQLYNGSAYSAISTAATTGYVQIQNQNATQATYLNLLPKAADNTAGSITAFRATRGTNGNGGIACLAVNPAGALSSSNVNWNVGLYPNSSALTTWFNDGTTDYTALQISTQGVVNIISNVATSSTTTGALVVAGGVGVGGNVSAKTVSQSVQSGATNGSVPFVLSSGGIINLGALTGAVTINISAPLAGMESSIVFAQGSGSAYSVTLSMSGVTFYGSNSTVFSNNSFVVTNVSSLNTNYVIKLLWVNNAACMVYKVSI